MLIEDEKGNQLLELVSLSEADLGKVASLTHALVVVRRNGAANLLVFNRRRQYWELAGGLIDAGETPRDCAARELREESGLACSPASLRFVGVAKFLLQPSRFHPEAHVEHGAIYSTDIDEPLAFVADDETAGACWWDGREDIGAISVIDRKLIEFV